jgi:phosphatidylserine/phosphatidylglycerophosphate/cardiolipin synthase-like enzyme
MIEMIKEAKTKITLVGYRVEEYALPIMSSLQDAIARNVDVSLVLDRAEDHIYILRRLWKNFPASKLYTLKTDPKDPKRSLHAKLIVIDYSVLLVTSANLTYHGLSSNLEIGVKISGEAAYEAQLLINSLMREGYLVAAK